MKKRMISLILGVWMLFALGIAGYAAPAGVVDISGKQENGELQVTVSIHDVKLNVLEVYLAYDAKALTPIGGDEGVLEALQPAYDPWEDEGWMQTSAAKDEENGVIRCVVMADPEARNGDTLDSEGYLSVGEAPMELFRVRFAVQEGAQVYADSVHLGKSAGAENGIVIADGTAQGITGASSVRIDLGTTEKTPGGVGEGYFGGRPEPEPTQTPEPTGQPGSSGGTTGAAGNPGTQDTDPSAPAEDFTDITNHWAKASIEKLVSAGVIRGYGDGTFRPNASLTRAELCSVLAAYFGLPETESLDAGFTDCTAHWAVRYINAAQAAGLVSGIGGGAFAPDRAVTRQEFVTILSRAAKLEGGSADFTDREEIASWAEPHVAAAVAAGLITGYPDGSFRPNNGVTRAEMCTVLAQMTRAAVET